MDLAVMVFSGPTGSMVMWVLLSRPSIGFQSASSLALSSSWRKPPLEGSSTGVPLCRNSVT